jgi:hypothetical protein
MAATAMMRIEALYRYKVKGGTNGKTAGASDDGEACDKRYRGPRSRVSINALELFVPSFVFVVYIIKID